MTNNNYFHAQAFNLARRNSVKNENDILREYCSNDDDDDICVCVCAFFCVLLFEGVL
jgi:hypothetical protein